MERIAEGTKGLSIETPSLQQSPSQYAESVATSGYQSFAVPSVSQQTFAYPQYPPYGQPMLAPSSGYYTANGTGVVNFEAGKSMWSNQLPLVNTIASNNWSHSMAPEPMSSQSQAPEPYSPNDPLLRFTSQASPSTPRATAPTPSTPRASHAPCKRPGSTISYASIASKACKV